jgi:hypothetical protein
VTDSEGVRWLVGKLKLPFTTIRTDLDSLDMPGEFWAYGKVVAYGLQEEPFFHIDGDVYLTGKLPKKYEKAALVCQFFEEAGSFPYYKVIYENNRRLLERQLKYLPRCWRHAEDHSAGNCGIFGGRNIDAVRQYVADVKALVTDPRNASGWKAVKITDRINCVVEQLMLWCSAREQNIPITPLFEVADFRDPAKFKAKALRLHFNHAAAEGKNPRFGEHLGQCVEAEFPEQFAAINRAFPRTFLDLGLPTEVRYDDEEESAQTKISRVEAVQIHRRKRTRKDDR